MSAYLFLASTALTLLIYILRGVGLLTFLPGGIILILATLSILTAIAYSFERRRRF